MAMQTATISGQLLRPDLASGAMTVHIHAVTDGTRLAYAGKVIAGKIPVRISSNGNASVTLPKIPQSGLTPTGALWRVTFKTAYDVNHWDFTLTADTTWDQIVDVSDVPITPAIQAAAEAARDAALAAQTAAAASASTAAAAAASATAIADPNGGYVHQIGNGNGTDDTTALNALLATAGNYKGTPGQNYIISAPLVIKSGTRLDMTGCTVTMKAGSNCNFVNNRAVSTSQRTIAGSITAGTKTFTLTTGTASSADVGRTFVIAGAGPNAGGFALSAKVVTFTDATHVVLDVNAVATVSAASTTVYDRDTDIAIVGGTWDRGSNAGAGSAQHSFYLRRVDRLYIDLDRFVSVWGSGAKYAIHPGDVTSFALRVKSINHGSDGIHVRGPASRGVIWGTEGITNDDFVILGASDSSRVVDGGGDISDVEIYDLRPGAMVFNAVKLYGNAGTTVKSIHINGVRSSLGRGVSVGAGDITGTTLDDITVENVTTGNSNPVQLAGPNTGGTIRIRNCTTIDSTATDVVTVVNVAAGAVWDRVIVENPAGPNMSGTASGGGLVTVLGTVASLVVDKAKATLPGAGAAVLLSGASASITRLYLNNLDITNGGGVVKSATAGQVLGEVWYRDCWATGTSFLGDFVGTTTVHMSGLVGVSLGNNPFNARATSSLKFYGEGNTLPGGNAVAAGAVVSVYTSDMTYSSTAGAVPTIAAGAGAGTTPTVSIVGSDRMGTITVTTGTTPSAAALATVTFTRAFGAAPRTVQITPTSAGGGAVNPYVSSKTSSTFVLSAQTAPAASTSHTFDYLVTA